MTIRVVCPACGHERPVPIEATWSVLTCPSCGTRQMVNLQGRTPEQIRMLAETPIVGRVVRPDRPRLLPTAPPPPSAARDVEPIRKPREARPVEPDLDDSESRTPAGPSQATLKIAAVASLAVLFGVFSWFYFFQPSDDARARVRPPEPPPEPAPRVASAPEVPPSAPQPAPTTAESTPSPEPAAPAPEPTSPAPALAVAAPAPEVPATPAPDADSRAIAEAARASKHAEANGDPAPVLSTADIVERCEPSIALIRGATSTGTGFMVGPKLMATAAHVIDGEPMSALEVRFPSAPDGRQGPHRASLLYEDPARDLAFLSVETDLPPLTLAPRYEYRKGDDVTVIGNPGIGDGVVLENAIARGVMSTKTTLDGQVFYQLSIAINPGNSGGPVIDPGGRVIGVANLKTTEQEALAFSIPVEDLRVALDRLAAQSPDDLATTRARHRLHAAFQGESLLGALFGFGLEMQLAARVVHDDPDVPEQAKALDELLTRLTADAYAPIADEARQVGNDPSHPAEVRQLLDQLAEATRQLKSLYENARGNLPLDQIRALKSAHRHLVETLRDRLDAELPETLVAAMSDHIESRPDASAVPSMPFSAFSGPSPGQSLHEWMMERHRSMRPPGFPSMPGFRRFGGFGGRRFP